MAELSLDGLPLLFDLQQQAGSFLRQYQPLVDLLLHAHPIQTNNSKDSTVGPALIGLPKPNYPPPPPPRLNQLYYPTGAARWARGYFLAGKSDATALTLGRPVPFKAEFADVTIETELYVLTPHPISCTVDAETLFLVPVVDERYYWQYRHVGGLGKPDLGTWSDLYSYLATQLGITLTVDSIADAYLSPDPDEFTRRYDNAATLLDAVAHSAGHRITRQLDGTYHAISWTNSAQEYDRNLSTRTPWYQIAGDPYTPSPVPSAVTVAFPLLVDGAPDCRRRVYAIATNYTGTAETVSATSKVIHSSAWAATDVNGNLSNYTELSSLASQIASDYYDGLAYGYDFTFAGVKEWYFTGYDDHALYSLGCEDEQACLTAKTDTYQQDERVDADTRLAAHYDRVCLTRIQSAPLNFGCDQQLQQGQLYEAPAGTVGLELVTTLLPGQSATAYVLRWNGSAWVADGTQLVTLADPFYRNCLFSGERCWGRRNCEAEQYEVVGENGLRRTAVAQESIEGGSSGSVAICIGADACARVTTSVVVAACHLTGAGTIEAQVACFLHYHPDHRRWFIVSSSGGTNRNAEQRIAFGTLAGTLTPPDNTPTYVTVNDLVYLDGTSPVPSSVSARTRVGCRGNQGDTAILVRVTEPLVTSESSSLTSGSTTSTDADVWEIIVVEHKKVTMLTPTLYIDPEDGQLKGLVRDVAVMYGTAPRVVKLVRVSTECPDEESQSSSDSYSLSYSSQSQSEGQ